ncbi:MAG TPA: PspC domain-containing protein [Steroidobacteraceae bacterium]|jgi:phage shock protein PspC (stress-responsive transcriptional regulator)|nr:PspC domain-containing protein [Steroidobacteraceae bacterium]
MRTVTSISLNGNAWQIETEGCTALAAYLKSAETRLAGDPDRVEILADLEQAIADKLSRHVSAHKNVVTAQEITQALKEMGPVESGAAPGPDGPADGAAPGTAGSSAQGYARAQGGGPAGRHLFQIREGAMLSGVCNGLAAYFGVDVTLVRVIFAVFAVLTGGIGMVVYAVMMLVVPVAITAEQMAAAHGKPFNAEELIGRPQGPQANFSAGEHWRQQWREQRRMWRDQRRQWRRQQRAWHGAPYPGNCGPPPVGFGPLSAVVRALMLIAFLVALVGAAAGRPLLGWDWTSQVPNWVGIVAVCVIYGTLVKQMRMARYYGRVGAYSPGHALVALFGTILWLLILVVVGWYVLHHWPEVQDFLQRVVQAIQDAFDSGSHNSVST